MNLFHFERRHEPLAGRGHFFLRLMRNLVISSGVLGVAVALGAWGFLALFENIKWDNAIHNAVKILSGMDPVISTKDTTTLAKCFEIAYHLLAQLAIVVATTIFLAPLIHRVLHKFHVDE